MLKPDKKDLGWQAESEPPFYWQEGTSERFEAVMRPGTSKKNIMTMY